ncbi:MAG: DUF4118 domain-containing protein [Deltaproteobacteria bacterium]|nr:DUF4118 domain-containing protein [Deltaproteobacteria bacterium]
MLWEYLLAACGVSLCTGLGFILFPHLALRNLAMIYLLTVVVISSFLARGPALFSSFFCAAAFAFFFVPKYYSFAIPDTESAVTLMVMLLVSTLTSGLTTRIRHQARVARQQERQTAALYEMSQNIGAWTQLRQPGLFWLPCAPRLDAYNCARRRRKALATTETEEKLMAAAAIMGLSKMPNQG